MTHKTRWAELFPDEFLERQTQKSIIYLPLGICEPHGHISTFGLDTFKADYLCDESARRFGGIVAPTLAYQIHEAGYHAPWLAEVLGEQPALMTGMPPHVMLHFFLYQLRSFHNAGFNTAIIISGHSGGNQHDFRLAAKLFGEVSDMKIWVFADPELVADFYEGDHAGQYEISQSLYLRPDTIDLSKVNRMYESGSLGRFAQGEDALEASAEKGKDIIEKSLAFIEQLILKNHTEEKQARKILSYEVVEMVFEKLRERRSEWVTLQKYDFQNPTPEDSQWKEFETVKV
ncbi:MAG: creatininase family protein [Arcicella sp.]|jgi:creatinine amidohydrolase|nr:creatininase family protein [Arcicella sp.]